jgi:hypothetical protein
MKQAAKDQYRLPAGRQKVLAHDVRHLGLCAICGGIADQRTSISYEAARGYKASDPNAMWHPKCTFDEFGEAFVLDLPESEQAKFCLGDIPAETMRKILDGI